MSWDIVSLERVSSDIFVMAERGISKIFFYSLLVFVLVTPGSVTF